MSEQLAIYDFQSSAGVVAGDDIPVTNSFFAWGTVLKESTEDIFFIVRNQSLQYTANGVVLQSVDVGSPSVSLSDQLLFSIDNMYYAKVLDLGNIPPGAATLPITLRRVTSSNAVSGSYQIKLQASAWI